MEDKQLSAIEFMKDWDKAHTSQPSYQDVIDWVLNKIKEKDYGKTND